MRHRGGGVGKVGGPWLWGSTTSLALDSTFGVNINESVDKNWQETNFRSKSDRLNRHRALFGGKAVLGKRM